VNNPIATKNPKHGRFLEALYKTVQVFSLTEKAIFYILLAITIGTGLTLLSNLNNRFLIEVPNYGGSATEGIVGVPRFVNPVLAASDADKDLTSLIFSGLLKSTSNGSLSPDLAEKYEISADGRTYTFTLRDDLYFHDNKAVTTDDVEFTIQRIQDPTVKSPKRPVWDGVQIQKMDSKRISFTLKQPYAPFLDNFTIGILPKHIWNDVPSDEFSFSELNANAVGSGPYKIDEVKRNSYGLANYYNLQSFKNYALGKPFIKNINFRFYQNESDLIDAFKNDEVTSLAGISPANLEELDMKRSKVISTTLPRVFGVFFNQNQATVFLNKEVRQALNVAIDKKRIVDEVLFGFGEVINSPVPPSSNTTKKVVVVAEETVPRVDEALSILTKAGWTLNTKTGVMEKKIADVVVPLSFSLATGDSAELRQTAELVMEDWRKIGVSVDLKISEIGDLNQNMIRPRKFDALLFGEVVGWEFDLYPFWHSSQRNDPGLNVALYANIAADKILESIRTTQEKAERRVKAGEFEGLFTADMPAVFIYSPSFVYVTPASLQNISLNELTNPSERFLNVNEWYIETNRVWKIFAY